MPDSDEITRIRLGKHMIGIIGLKQVLSDLSETGRRMTDEELQQELVKHLSKRNYISDNARHEYGRAFLDAFKNYIGEPLTDEPEPCGMEIKVFGGGCARCNFLEQEIMNIIAELGIDADVEYVKDVQEIAAYGVRGVPALMINGEVKAAGDVPPRSRIISWLKKGVGYGD